MEEINTRIENEICYDIINNLRDENLLHEYIKCKSVKKEIKKLEEILDKYINIDDKVLDAGVKLIEFNEEILEAA